jgi:hypothetical protein
MPSRSAIRRFHATGATEFDLPVEMWVGEEQAGRVAVGNLRLTKDDEGRWLVTGGDGAFAAGSPWRANAEEHVTSLVQGRRPRRTVRQIANDQAAVDAQVAAGTDLEEPPRPVQRTPVSSAVFTSVGYDQATRRMQVEFHNGRVTTYNNVSESTWDEFRTSSSLGRYYSRHIRSNPAYLSGGTSPNGGPGQRRCGACGEFMAADGGHECTIEGRVLDPPETRRVTELRVGDVVERADGADRVTGIHAGRAQNLLIEYASGAQDTVPYRGTVDGVRTPVPEVVAESRTWVEDLRTVQVAVGDRIQVGGGRTAEVTGVQADWLRLADQSLVPRRQGRYLLTGPPRLGENVVRRGNAATLRPGDHVVNARGQARTVVSVTPNIATGSMTVEFEDGGHYSLTPTEPIGISSPPEVMRGPDPCPMCGQFRPADNTAHECPGVAGRADGVDLVAAGTSSRYVHAHYDTGTAVATLTPAGTQPPVQVVGCPPDRFNDLCQDVEDFLSDIDTWNEMSGASMEVRWADSPHRATPPDAAETFYDPDQATLHVRSESGRITRHVGVPADDADTLRHGATVADLQSLQSPQFVSGDGFHTRILNDPQVATLGYNPDTRVLRAEFRNGWTGEFPDVDGSSFAYAAGHRDARLGLWNAIGPAVGEADLRSTPVGSMTEPVALAPVDLGAVRGWYNPASREIKIVDVAGQVTVYPDASPDAWARVYSSFRPTATLAAGIGESHGPPHTLSTGVPVTNCTVCGRFRAGPHDCPGPARNPDGHLLDGEVRHARWTLGVATFTRADGTQGRAEISEDEYSRFLAAPEQTWEDLADRVEWTEAEPAELNVPSRFMYPRAVQRTNDYTGQTEWIRTPHLSHIREHARTIPHGESFDVPLTSRLDGQNNGGHVRITRNRNGRLTVSDIARLDGDAAQNRATVETFQAMLSARRVRGSFAQIRADHHAVADAARLQDLPAPADPTVATATWAPEASWAGDMDRFQAAYQAARERVDAGDSPVPFLTENATEGLSTRENGRGFGVEIEFDGGDRQAIARDLYDAGLIPQPRQTPYHSARTEGMWAFETDCTVDGEIISPVCFDEPETWAQLQQVCEIVRRHGGRATARTGGHVHVGVGDWGSDPSPHSNLMREFSASEDTIFRVAQNPARNSHRGTSWCAPNRAIPAAGYRSLTEVQNSNYGHSLAMNFQHVRGRRDRPRRVPHVGLDPGPRRHPTAGHHQPRDGRCRQGRSDRADRGTTPGRSSPVPVRYPPAVRRRMGRSVPAGPGIRRPGVRVGPAEGTVRGAVGGDPARPTLTWVLAEHQTGIGPGAAPTPAWSRRVRTIQRPRRPGRLARNPRERHRSRLHRHVCGSRRPSQRPAPKCPDRATNHRRQDRDDRGPVPDPRP